MTDVAVIHAVLEEGGVLGHGEAAGVDYDGETTATMVDQITALGPCFCNGFSTADLRAVLPSGGARNALDCALWDLRAKQSGSTVAEMAGLPALHPLETALTIGLAEDHVVHERASAARAFSTLKVKVDAVRNLDVVELVHRAHPTARIIVDANESWSFDQLSTLEPRLRALRVALIEQPLPRADDHALAAYRGEIPLAADESCTDDASLSRLSGLYGVANIKLDKCGGLTEGLRMIDTARRLGMECMIGNMCGSSLAMAPAFVVGQRCRYVDLDGPLLQVDDRTDAIRYEAGRMWPPRRALWG